MPEREEFEFFGVKLKVRNRQLALLLNGDDADDVQVVRHRSPGPGDDDARAERDVEARLRRAADVVQVQLEPVEDR